MNTAVTRVWGLTLIGGIVVGTLTACVSAGTYEEARLAAQRQLQNEQRVSQGLAGSNKLLKQWIDELESSLRHTREQLTRTEKEWRETRDELLKLKIEKEQQRRGE